MSELSQEVKAALLGAIIGGLIVAVATFVITGYFTNQQIDLDKKSTAQQLSNDMSNLDIQLRFYSQAYTQNLDLSKTGAIWPDDVINPNSNTPTLLIVDDTNNTATAPYVIAMNNGTYEETKLNTEGLARIRSPFYGYLKEPAVYPIQLADPKNSIYCTLSYPIMPAQLYNEHGVYYEYGTHMSGFNNKNLSQDLYVFYYLLAQAESDRQYVQNYLDSHPNAKLERQYFNAYMEMRWDVIHASRMTDPILGELNAEM
jgi:hypothetical protein